MLQKTSYPAKIRLKILFDDKIKFVVITMGVSYPSFRVPDFHRLQLDTIWKRHLHHLSISASPRRQAVSRWDEIIELPHWQSWQIGQVPC